MNGDDKHEVSPEMFPSAVRLSIDELERVNVEVELTLGEMRQLLARLSLRRDGTRHELDAVLCAVQVATMRAVVATLPSSSDLGALSDLYDDTLRAVKRKIEGR